MPDDHLTIGRYRVLERIGRGAMGVLYRGTDPLLDREVAIKVMSAEFAADGDEKTRGRFFREARAAAKLQHRNIVTIFEFAEENGMPYIVMEFLRGQSLSTRMKTGPPLTLEQTLDIVTELCAGLEFAHQNGVVHRDVKPANIWLLQDGSVKLLDFGIAKFGSSTFTRHGDILGSASYMAPEQVQGGTVDGRADVFAATVVLFELLAGRKPFEGDSPTSTILKIMQDPPPALDAVMTDAPPALVAAVAQGLAKNPDDRFQTAGDCAAELQLIRMSLQSTGDTVFGSDLPLGETISSPVPSQQTTMLDDRTKALPDDFRTAPFTRPAEPPRREPAAARRTAIWIGAAVAAALLVTGVAAWRVWSKPDNVQSAAAPAEAPVPTPPVTQVPVNQPPVNQVPVNQPPVNQAPVNQPPALPVATMTVTSEPNGASIEIDGRDSGLTTPASIPLGDQPPKRIRVVKKGFQTSESRVTKELLAAGALSVRLAPAESALVKVSITGTYAFDVLDGKKVVSAEATSHELAVPAGRILRLRAPSHLLNYPFKVEAGSSRVMQVQAPGLGRLSVRTARETCQVVVNGQELGLTPFENQSAAAGTYGVQLKCDGQLLQGTSVTVNAGETAIARVR
jgi:serine/threonine-protein kinase